MAPGGRPEWPGATWIAVLDLADLDLADLNLADLDVLEGQRTVRCPVPGADGYSRARILIRDGVAPVRFVETDIVDGHVTLPVPERAASTDAASTATAKTDVGALPPISVVLCTRERPDDLRGALASLRALDYPDFEIVVVDNAPTSDGTARVVAEVADPRVRRVVEPVPGLSRARNAGLRAASHALVAYTDDDVVADSGWLRGIARGFARAGDVACVCGTVPSGELRTLPQAYFDWRVSWGENLSPRVFRLAEPPADLPLFPFQVRAYGTGANIAVRRDTVLALGSFDERLGAGTSTKGGEDLDIFLRMLTAGHALAVEPSAIVWHRHRADNDALLSQARGYGVGFGAWLTKLAVTSQHRRLAFGVAVRRAREVGRAGRDYAAIASPPPAFTSDLPRSIGRTEVMSVLAGPRALWSESRRVRRGSVPAAGPREEGRA